MTNPPSPQDVAPHEPIAGTQPAATHGFRTGLQLLLWVWFGTVLALNIPGHLTTDSLIQIAEGRTGYVDSWNPIFSSWVFGTLAELTGGTEVIVLVSTLMVAAAMGMLVGAARRGGWWVLLPCCALLFTPILLVHPGIVWKDVWFAHSAALAFGLIMWRVQGHAWWWELPALLLVAVALLSRQTGIIVCVAAVVGLSVAVPLRRPTLRPWLACALGSAIRMAVVVAMAAGLSAWAKGSMKAIRADAVGTGFQLVAIFDVAGVLQREPEAKLELLRSQGFETTAWEAAARQTFSAERIDTLVLPPITGPKAISPMLMIQQWAHLVGQHPGSYIAHRWEAFAWFGGLRDQARCVPIHVGIDPPERAQQANIRGVASRWSGPLYSWSRSFLQTPYFAPLAWNLVSLLVLLAYGLRRQWHEPVAWMQVAALAYSGSYLMAGLSCDFRYSYFSVLAASIGLMRVLADGVSLPRTQRT